MPSICLCATYPSPSIKQQNSQHIIPSSNTTRKSAVNTRSLSATIYPSLSFSPINNIFRSHCLDQDSGPSFPIQKADSPCRNLGSAGSLGAGSLSAGSPSSSAGIVTNFPLSLSRSIRSLFRLSLGQGGCDRKLPFSLSTITLSRWL